MGTFSCVALLVLIPPEQASLGLFHRPRLQGMLENPNALSRGKRSNENENMGHDLAWTNEGTTFQYLVLNLTEQAAQRQSAPLTMLGFDAIL